MRKNLMNKFTLRILSLFIAVFIWLLVVNIEDPVRTITITDVPVTFANESYIESMNKVALMEDGKDTVDVKVTGASSIVKKISRDNIYILKLSQRQLHYRLWCIMCQVE